ncbi:retrovirus-related pol polyprotein from transposon TNT 1-94 [Tanacetum coccineum]
MRKVQSFVPMGSELEVQRLKRAGQEVLEEPVKRQKIGEASGSGEESAEKEKELSEEELQKLLVIVPVEEVYVEALQVKYPIIDWEVYSEDTRRYWRIIRVGNHTEAYQIFADMLKKFDRDDLVKLWDLVKERFSTTEPTDDKEKELWVELKRLFEPDNDDTLWKLQRYMHDPLGNDLLTGSRGTDLYSISLQDSTTPNPICLMAKATSSQAWLWHRRLSHLNFDTINLLSKNNIVNGLPKLKFVKDHLCSSCELGKAKRKSFHTKTTPSSKRRYLWTHFLSPKMKTPGVSYDFLTLVQRGLHAQVTTVRTDKGTEFLNKTLHAFFAKEGIRHETSTARTPEQNGVVERRNRTLVEAARTMLSAAKVPLFFWAEDKLQQHVLPQNPLTIVIPRHEKINLPYHQCPETFSSCSLYIFGSLCYSRQRW